MEQKVGIFSVNINGLNSPIKRKKIYTKLLKEKIDIICLQETHIKEKNHKLLEYPKMGNLYYSADKEGGKEE